MNRKLRMGMIGGGQGAFIGAVHRMAAAIDNEIELVCGAFSSSPEKSLASGKALYLPDDRVYANYQDMILKEKELDEDKRMDFVTIVTPNHMHFGPAKMALENDFHVICDKPITFTLDEAFELKQIHEKTNLVFALTHNYAGYPMVKEARELVRSGKLGAIRKVIAEYPQGWLNKLLEATGQKQASWRTDPNRAGKGGAIGDIGIHAAHMAEYITGLKITEVCADVTIYVEGRQLDDDANVLLHFENGAKGVLHCSQICTGEENKFNIRVYGEEAGIEWHQMEPNTLIFKQTNKPAQYLRTGVGDLSEASLKHYRIPSGHPEGYVEAFANVYRNFAMAVKARMSGIAHNNLYDFPGIEEGIRGMQFIDKVIESGKSNQKWIAIN